KAPESMVEPRSAVLWFSLAMSVPVILNLVVSQRSEFFILEHYSTDRQIAFYSIAFSATAALIAVPRAFGAVLIPSVAALTGSGETDRIRNGFSRVLRLSLLFAIPITAAGLALGPDLLRLLYGHRYAGAGHVLLIVILTVPLTPLAGAAGAVIVGHGRVRAPVVISAIAAAVDIALAIALVQPLDAIGAAIANTCASVVATALLLAAAIRLVGGILLGWSSVLRVIAISAVAGAVARLVLLVDEGPGMFVVATLALVVTLAAGALVVRAVSEDDASFRCGVWGRRVRFTRVLERLSARPARAPARADSTAPSAGVGVAQRPHGAGAVEQGCVEILVGADLGIHAEVPLRPVACSLRDHDPFLDVREQVDHGVDEPGIVLRDADLLIVPKGEALEGERRRHDRFPCGEPLQDLHPHPPSGPDRSSEHRRRVEVRANVGNVPMDDDPVACQRAHIRCRIG